MAPSLPQVLDIDGLDPDDQGALLEGGALALGYLTASALVAALAIGAVSPCTPHQARGAF